MGNHSVADLVTPLLKKLIALISNMNAYKITKLGILLYRNWGKTKQITTIAIVKILDSILFPKKIFNTEMEIKFVETILKRKSLIK